MNMMKAMQQQKKAMEKMLKASASAGSKVATSMLERKSKDGEECCSAADALFHESMEMYKAGRMGWKAMVKDLNKALMAIEPKADGSDDGADDGENDGAQD